MNPVIPKPVAARIAQLDSDVELSADAQHRLALVEGELEACAKRVAVLVCEDNASKYDVGQLIRLTECFTTAKMFAQLALSLPQYPYTIAAAPIETTYRA